MNTKTDEAMHALLLQVTQRDQSEPDSVGCLQDGNFVVLVSVNFT